jgi:6-phosphogluconolactonase
MTQLTTVADVQAASQRAAQELARLLQDSLERRGRAHIALAGGSTPRAAYELLAGLVPDWSAVELWYGDERCVGPEDPESNHRLVVESLLARIPGAPPHEHRIRGELGAEEAARAYEEELRSRVPPPDMPVLDVALLGIGEDGHTASLFPGHAEVCDESGALCLPVHDAPKPPPDRVTLSIAVLRAARHGMLLATGAAKADALAAALAGPDPRVPASLLASERLHVIADDAAAPPVSVREARGED